MHCYLPVHNIKYMVYDIFLESSLGLIMVELALNSTVKDQFIAVNFSARKNFLLSSIARKCSYFYFQASTCQT
jgi:hypothetical protein